MIKILEESSKNALVKMTKILNESGVNANHNKSVSELSDIINEYETRIVEMKSESMTGYMRKQEYIDLCALKEHAMLTQNIKNECMCDETVPSVIYPNAQVNDNVLTYDHVDDEYNTMSASMPLPVAKAITIFQTYSLDDFNKIYFGMADGSDNPFDVSMNHLVNSSNDALGMIEEYCDSLWEGKWPWEFQYETVNESIYNAKKERNMNHQMLKESVEKLLEEFETDMDDKMKSHMIASDMVDTLDSIIANLGKLAATGVELKTELEDSNIENALGDPMNDVIDALAAMKRVLTGEEEADVDMDVDLEEPDEEHEKAEPIELDDMEELQLDGEEEIE